MTRFVILMYHMISRPQSQAETKYACPPESFEIHLRKLLQNGYLPVSLESIESHFLSNTPLPKNAVAITLDDGFEDNYTNAFPLLAKYKIPATIFLATGHIEATNSWMAQRDFPVRPMLNWKQIKEMDANGVSFGAHTVNHTKLPDLDSNTATYEITVSKSTIEDKLGKACKHFAYPYGLFNDEHRNMVEAAGFTLASSTRSGFNNINRDPFVLHRIEVYGNDPWWKLKQKLTFGTNDASLLFPLKYYSNRLMQRLQKNE